jgi:hypothetical protein
VRANATLQQESKGIGELGPQLGSKGRLRKFARNRHVPNAVLIATRLLPHALEIFMSATDQAAFSAEWRRPHPPSPSHRCPSKIATRLKATASSAARLVWEDTARLRFSAAVHLLLPAGWLAKAAAGVAGDAALCGLLDALTGAG